MEEKIQAILAEEGFVEKLMDCEEPEQVQALFAEKGVELSLDDVMGISILMRSFHTLSGSPIDTQMSV